MTTAQCHLGHSPSERNRAQKRETSHAYVCNSLKALRALTFAFALSKGLLDISLPIQFNNSAEAISLVLKLQPAADALHKKR